MRALGPDVAEVPVLAVRPDLQGNGLGHRLLAPLEAALLGAGIRMMAMPGGVEPDLAGASSGADPDAPAPLPDAAATGAPQVHCAPSLCAVSARLAVGVSSRGDCLGSVHYHIGRGYFALKS